MSKRIATIAAIAAIACLASGATAQTTTAPAARPGGLGGLLGGALPGVGAIGAGNAAGLLGYCLKNNLLGSAGALAGTPATAPGTVAPATPAPASGARTILDRLTGRQGVQTSPGFALGQAGQVQAPGGRALSLNGLGDQVKTRMCGLVLDRAKSLL